MIKAHKEEHTKDIFVKRLYFYFILFFIFLYPILDANFFHFDDLGRSIYGYFYWTAAGRPAASFLYRLITLSEQHITDIAPLSQILGILALAASCSAVSLIDQFREKYRYIPLAFIGLSPFMIDNYSYRYDSLFMAIATALAISPLFLFYMFKKYNAVILSSAALLCVYNLYQPAINDYTELFILYCISILIGFKKHVSLHLLFIPLVIASIFYEIELVATNIIPNHGFSSRHSGFSFSFSTIIRNFINYFDQLNLAIYNQPERLIFIIMIIIISFGSIYFLKNIFKYIIAILLIVAAIPMILGPLLLLRNPVYGHIVLIGFGGFMCILAWTSTIVMEKIFSRKAPLFVFYLVIFLPQFDISYAYGNAQYAQKEYNRMIGENLAREIYHLVGSKAIILGVNGHNKIAPKAKIIIRNYNIINSPMDRPWSWSEVTGLWYLQSLGFGENFEWMKQDQVNKAISGCRLDGYSIYKFYYYNIYYNKHSNRLIVDFDKNCKKMRQK